MQIEKLENKILSATTFSAIARALLEIDYAITEAEQQLNLSGNMTDKAIIELEGRIRALQTLKIIGNARVQDIKNWLHREANTRYKFAKIVKREAPDDYARWMEEAKQD